MEIVYGTEVSKFLERIRRRPDQYREVVVCTPFLDERTVAVVREIAMSAPRVRCGFRLLTRMEAANKVLQWLPMPRHAWKGVICVRHRIHAKVYLAMARVHRKSEVIVTSANLTTNGMRMNEELGVRFTGETTIGRSALARIHSSIHKWIQ